MACIEGIFYCHQKLQKSKKTLKWSSRRTRKCNKLLTQLQSDVNSPATLHCFEVPDEFDETLDQQYRHPTLCMFNFENYIGVQSFTSFNKSTKKRVTKKSTARNGEPGLCMKMLREIGLFCQSCIISV